MPTLPPIPDIAAMNSVGGYLANVVRIEAAIQALTADRFIADRLFSPPPSSTANATAVSFEQVTAGGQFTVRDVEARRPGSTFPRLTVGGVLMSSLVEQYGGEIGITWEERDDNRTDLLGQRQTALGNTLVRKSDTVAIDALAVAPTNTLAAGTGWGTATAVQKLGNIIDAISLINDADLGYLATMFVGTPAQIASLLKEKDIRDGLVPSTSAALGSGSIGTLLGIEFFASPRIPVGTAYVAAGRQIGSLAGDAAPRVHRYEDDPTHQTLVQSWRRLAALVTSPLAAVRITGLVV